MSDMFSVHVALRRKMARKDLPLTLLILRQSPRGADNVMMQSSKITVLLTGFVFFRLERGH